MKINWQWYDNINHVLSWFTVIATRNKINEEDLIFTPEFNPQEIEVELKINGVDIDIVKVLDTLEKEMKEQAEKNREIGREEAKEEVIDKITNLLWETETL